MSIFLPSGLANVPKFSREQRMPISICFCGLRISEYILIINEIYNYFMLTKLKDRVINGCFVLKDRVINGCFVTKDRVMKRRFMTKDRVIKGCFMTKDRVMKMRFMTKDRVIMGYL